MRLVGLLPEPGNLAERRRYPGDPCLVKWKTGVTFDMILMIVLVVHLKALFRK